MIQESEIRQKLSALLQYQISLDEFEDWLVEHSWNMHKDSQRSAQDLVSAVELAFSEYSNGHLNDKELRDRLVQALGQIVVNVRVTDNFAVSPLKVSIITTGTSSGPPQMVWVPALI
jgi:hypothetical protein